MKIKTRIQVCIILCFVLTVTTGSLIFSAIQKMKLESIEAIATAKIVKEMAELNIIMHEYLLHPGERSLIQWKSIFDHLEKRLKQEKKEFDDQDEKILLNKIHLDLLRLGAAFDNLTTGCGKEHGHDMQKDTNSSELEERLIGELLVKSRSMVSPVFQLQQTIQADLVATQQKTILFVVIFIVIFIVFISGILLWIDSSVVKPVLKLKEGSQIIGSGNLNHKVGIDAQNEIGQLTRAFDKMTEDLRSTTFSKDYVDNIIQSMINSLIVVTQEDTIQTVNKATCDLLGYRPEELLEQPIDKILSKDETQAMSRGTGTKELIKKGFIQEIETIYMSKDGCKIPVLFSGSVIHDSDNKIMGIVFVALDITGRKNTENQRDNLLYDMGERLKELNCLYGIADIVEKYRSSFDDIFQEIANIIPSSLQYSDIACVRIVVEGFEYKTANFQETIWEQAADIQAHDKRAGTIKVYYTEHRPEIDGGPFLKEERMLLNTVSERLGKIIEHKRAKQALAKSEEMFKTIFNQAPYGIALIGSFTGHIYEVNPKFAQIAGRTVEQMATIDWMSITHPDDVQKDLDNMALLNAGTIPGFNMEKRYIHPDGSNVWIDMTITPVTVEDKTHPRHLCMIQDITASKKAAEEKKRLQAEALRTGQMASLGELAAGVAHEINNPINGIIGCAEILRDQFDENNEDIEIPVRIIKTGERVAKIVKNLLKYSRDREDEYSPAHIRDILSDTLALMEKQISKDGIKLSVDAPLDLPKIKASSQELQQVFLNLLSNARYAVNARADEFDGDRYINIKAVTSEFEESRCVRITFHDNGTGIPENIIRNLSDPFFTTKPAGEGTGLGLHISREIIKKHKGRLWFDSVEGEFTKALVDLPVNNG